jgi:hypothetical protein
LEYSDSRNIVIVEETVLDSTRQFSIADSRGRFVVKKKKMCVISEVVGS